MIKLSKLLLFFLLILLIAGNSFCQKPKLIIPETKFEDYNCTKFINEHTVIVPFHNSARVYKESDSTIQLQTTIKLDADPFSIGIGNKHISLVDWNNKLYILDKNNFNILFTDSLEKTPKEIVYFEESLIIVSNYSLSIYNNEFNKIIANFDSKIQGVISEKNGLKIVTSNGTFFRTLDNVIQKLNSFTLEKIENNSIFNEPIFFSSETKLLNELYITFEDSFLIKQNPVISPIKTKFNGEKIFILDSTDIFYIMNSMNNELVKVATNIKDFNIQDSKLFLLEKDSLTIIDLNSNSRVLKINIPKTYDLRKVFVLEGNILITYSDLSFIFFSNYLNKWLRVNEKSGFKGNLCFNNDRIICSGDSQVFTYNLLNRTSTFIPNLYTFTSLKSGEILFYGSENSFQLDQTVKRILKKYDPKNLTSIKKIELFDSNLVIQLYNGRLIIVYKNHERLIENCSYFEKISDHQVLYENSGNLYNLNFSSSKDYVLDSFNEKTSLSFQFADSSIVILLSNGYGKRYFQNDNRFRIEFIFPEEYTFSSCFHGNENDIFLTTWNGYFLKFNDTNNSFQIIHEHKYPLFSGSFSDDYNIIGIADLQGQIKVFNNTDYREIFTLFNLLNNEKVVIDKYGHFDGTINGLEQIQLLCVDDHIGLNQLKDALYIPNLVHRILIGEDLSNLPKIDDLQICGVTPIVEKTLNKYEYKIIPRYGGVSVVEIYINNILRETIDIKRIKKINEYYLLKIKKNQIKKYATSGIPLEIKVIAKTADNSVSSRGVIVEVADNQKQTQIKPSIHAIMIGVDDYKDESLQLKYAAKDANDLQLALQLAAKNYFNIDDTNRVFFYNLTINTEGETGTKDIRGITPDRGNIIKTLKDIEKTSKPEDIILLFFAGHGEIVDKEQLLLLTVESTRDNFQGIKMNELLSLMNEIPAGKRILILDACHSGAAINNLDMAYFSGKRDVKDVERESQRLKELDKLANKSGFAIITASSSDQKALELPQYEHGLLTYSLLSALVRNKSVLTDENQLVLEKWFIAAEEEMTKLNKNQSAEKMVPISFNLGIVDDEVKNSIQITEIPMLEIGEVINENQFNNDLFPLDNLEIEEKMKSSLQALNESKSQKIYLLENSDNSNYRLIIKYNDSRNEIKIKFNIIKNGSVFFKTERATSLEMLEKTLNDIVLEIANQL